ncbi:MAG TPA: serine--tRNA ligase [Candidatus Babeliales bacterium]|nr:serine--tRNA ligase [Candidatus Babeliales bacterium]
MINLHELRTDTDRVISLLQKKDPSFDIHTLINLDEKVRLLKQEVESLRGKKNELAEAAKGGVTDAIRASSIEIGKQLKQKEQLLIELEQEFKVLVLSCPNVPAADLPLGGKEANRVVKEVGKKLEYDFEVKNHLDLMTALGWIDFERAAVMTGANFALYRGEAVKLMYALTMLMFKNNLKHGYEPILPPYLINERSLEISGNFPKFKDQAYAIPEDGLYLTPTAEVPLTNMYRDHIFMAQELPLRMTSWTSCFRREAGGYGAAERGLIRIHQFEKLELYTICEPEKSFDELDRMIACAESILQMLGLHYRISLLAAQDCSFQSAKTYDIEVWMPGQKAFYEVSSCSNCTDFQARRGMIRYRDVGDQKAQFVHTLNASSLALPRLMVALIETYQKADGTIEFPDVLKKEMMFV